jgi:hypothetical protein
MSSKSIADILASACEAQTKVRTAAAQMFTISDCFF